MPIAAALAVSAALHAQSVMFSNEGRDVFANTWIYDADGTTRLSGTAFWVELYLVGPGNSLTPLGSPINFLTGAKSGLFYDPIPRIAPLPANSIATFEVLAWEAPSLTFAAAQTTPGAKWGGAPAVTLFLGNDSAGDPPVGLVGLQSFAIIPNGLLPIPEPATFALGAMGLGAFLLRRWS